MPYAAARFRHRRVRDPGRFARGSLRTVPSKGGARVIIGHLRGERRRTGSGRLVQTVQAMLTPKPRRRNPWLAVMNPGGRKGAPIGVGVREVVYERHARHGRGPWRHTFKSGDVEVRGLPGGAAEIRSRSGVPVWSRDGDANWLDNPRGRRSRNPSAKHEDARRAFEREAFYHGQLGAYIGPTPDDAGATGLADRTLRRMYDTYYQFGTRHPIRNKGARVAKRVHHRTSKRRPPRGFKTWAAYMASIRPNPKRRKVRRHRTRHNPHKGESMARHRSRARRHGRRRGVMHNEPGRRRHRRHFRRNPAMTRGIGAALVDGVKGGALVVAGKIVSRAVPQFVGVTPVGPLGLGVQILAGGAAYVLLGRFAGREIARPFLYGVFGNAIESAVRGANVPVLSPALGDETELHALAGYVPAAAIAGRAGLSGYLPRTAGLGDTAEDADAGMPMLVM